MSIAIAFADGEIKVKKEVKLTSLYFLDNEKKISVHFSHYINGKWTEECETAELTEKELYGLVKPALILIKND